MNLMNLPTLEWFTLREEASLAFHNLLVHPAMGLLYLLGLKDLGNRLHDRFAPED